VEVPSTHILEVGANGRAWANITEEEVKRRAKARRRDFIIVLLDWLV
jgi:hypothetical protein